MADYVNIHTHKNSADAIEVVNLSGSNGGACGRYFSFGLHPWDIGKLDEEGLIAKLERLCKEKKVIAVGEIGLDRVIKTSIEKQKGYFLKQVEIANTCSLPVIIHSVRSNSDLLQIKKSLKSSTPWIFHGFKGNIQEVSQLIDKECLLSFGKSILQNEKVQEVLKSISLDSVFFETDDSDEKISTIYEKAAEILDICNQELKEKIYSNFIRIFKEPWKNIG